MQVSMSAGRMVSRTVDGVTTALTWDVTSSLVESDGQGGHVVYAYDASGQRVVQARVADADGVGTATAYVASGQVEDSNTAVTGGVRATRYYTFAGSTVPIRTDDGDLSLMLGDEQGSTNVLMPVTVQPDARSIRVERVCHFSRERLRAPHQPQQPEALGRADLLDLTPRRPGVVRLHCGLGARQALR